MRGKYRHFLATVLIVLGCGGGLAPSFAQDLGTKDPARWYVEDTTSQAHYQTSVKEARAAYQEALKECRQMKGSERAACLKEASANLQADLAQAKQQLGR